MKKIAIALVSLLLALTMVSCGSAFDNAEKYLNIVDHKDGKQVSIKQSDIDEKVKDYIDDLIKSYPNKIPVTEGTIDYEQVLKADYKAVLKLQDSDITVKWESSGITGFEDELKKVEFKDGKAVITLPLGDVTSSFSQKFTDVTKKEEDKTSKPDAASKAEETSKTSGAEKTETAPKATAPQAAAPVAEILKDAEPASKTADESKTSTSKEETKKLEHRFEVTIEGVNGKVSYNKDEEVKMHILWTVPEYLNKEDQEIRLAKKNADTSSPFPEEFTKKLVEAKVSVAAQTEATVVATYKSTYSANKSLQGKEVTYSLTVKEVIKEEKKDLKTAKDFDALKKECEVTNDAFWYTDYNEMVAEQTKNAKGALAMEAIVEATTVKSWPLSDLADYENTCRYAYSLAQSYGTSLMPYFGYSAWATAFNKYKLNITTTSTLSAEECTNVAGYVLRGDLVYSYLIGLVDEATDKEVDAYVKKNFVDAKVLNPDTSDDSDKETEKKPYEKIEDVYDRVDGVDGSVDMAAGRDYFRNTVTLLSLYEKLSGEITVVAD